MYPEHFYEMDRILVLNAADGATLNREHIYPSRKSDLERMLDQFFSLERRLPGQRALESLKNAGYLEEIQFEDQQDFLLRSGSSPHPSWRSNDRDEWIEGVIVAESYSSMGKPFSINVMPHRDLRGSVEAVAVQIVNALESHTIARSRPETFILQGGKTTRQAVPDVISAKFEELWDGIRRLLQGAKTTPQAGPDVISAKFEELWDACSKCSTGDSDMNQFLALERQVCTAAPV
jgi:hypothetical protein